MTDDHAAMAAALALGRRGLGRTWPNPAVGCVLVRDGAVVGRGRTRSGGRPHAETEALERAGAAARGADCFVTLEPCSHHGNTPPCADALASAGVARVVAAMEDPDPRVSGSGLARLRAAGTTVQTGPGAGEAAYDHAGFVSRVVRGRPLVAVKAATTLDGRIATRSGASRWITGGSARRAGHLLRARYDAIMVGARTARLDDPSLDCRLPGLEEHSPLRIVMDGGLRLPLGHRLASDGRPTWIVCREDADPDRVRAFADAGLRTIPVPSDPEGRPDVRAAATALGDAGLTRVLVEGGSILTAALLRAELVDRLHWFRAPKIIGGDGTAAVAGIGVEGTDDLPGFRRRSARRVGEDIWETYERCSRG